LNTFKNLAEPKLLNETVNLLKLLNVGVYVGLSQWASAGVCGGSDDWD